MDKKDIEQKWAEIEKQLNESTKELYGKKGWKVEGDPLHKGAKVETGKEGAQGAAEDFDASKKMDNAPANKNKEGAEEAAQEFEGSGKAAGVEGVDRKEGAAGGAEISKKAYGAKSFRDKVRSSFGLSLDDKLNKPNAGKEGLSESKKANGGAVKANTVPVKVNEALATNPEELRKKRAELDKQLDADEKNLKVPEFAPSKNAISGDALKNLQKPQPAPAQSDRPEKNRKFFEFLKTKLPDLAKKWQDESLNASMYGETILSPAVPDLTGDEAKDMQLAKDYMTSWFKAAANRERNPGGLGT